MVNGYETRATPEGIKKRFVYPRLIRNHFSSKKYMIHYYQVFRKSRITTHKQVYTRVCRMFHKYLSKFGKTYWITLRSTPCNLNNSMTKNFTHPKDRQ